jgi:outer membrane protein assembly factor BamB
MKFPFVPSMFRERGLALSAVAAARGEAAGSPPDGEGRAMPALAQARGRGRRRRCWPLKLRGARVAGQLATASMLIFAWAGLAVTPAQAQGTADWPAYLLDTGHSSFNSAATSIGTGNVANLQLVWQWMQPSGTARTFEASPTVVDGVVYIGSETGSFYAISEATRAVLWSRNFGVTPAGPCGVAGVTATAAVVNDPVTGLTVYVNAPDGQLYALSAATGATLWQSTVDTPSSTIDDYYAWGSPLVANGDVYVGISSHCDDPLVPSGVVEFNQDTGALQASWQTIPGGQAGGSVWSTPAASTLGDGSVFVTTGNAGSTPQPPNAESIVRLSGTDLSLQDSWQIPVTQQNGDGDFGGSPTIFSADLNGTTTSMVGACNKNGIYYAFRQGDLHDGPVWQQRIAASYGTQPNTGGQCDAAAIWDGTNLIEAGGNATVINGTTYQGSVQSLDPATGTPIWQTGLPGEVIGSPTEDGAGVVAAEIFQSNTGKLGVYLFSAASGAILGYINTSPSAIFSQPVFAGNDLLVAGNFAVGLTAYEITTPGPPVTAVTPSALGQGGSVTVTLTGSGFSGTPSVFVSGTLVTASSVVVNSPTSMQVKLSAASNAATGTRNITVIEPGPVADTCSGCLTIDPGPTVSSASPNSVPQGEKASITVTGTNFQPGAKLRNLTGVTFSGTTVVSSTQLTSTITISPTATLGTDKLSATNPDGGIGACSCLTVISDPAPTFSSVSPGSAGQQGSDTLTLTGTDFTTNSQLSFSASGITLKSLHYISPTSMTASIGLSGTATLGPGDMTVTTPGGSATCSGCLTVDPHPVITKLTPNTIPNGTTATVVVSGSNFVSGLRVTTTIPGATVGTPANVTSTSFSVPVTVPAGTVAGSYSLRVINPDNGTGGGQIKVT